MLFMILCLLKADEAFNMIIFYMIKLQLPGKNFPIISFTEILMHLSSQGDTSIKSTEQYLLAKHS